MIRFLIDEDMPRSTADESNLKSGNQTMRALDEIKSVLGQHRDVLADKYGIAVLAIFGSYVRDEQKKESDIDLLVEILRPISLLELAGAEIYLTEVLKTKVDLVPKRSVREELRETILREAIAL